MTEKQKFVYYAIDFDDTIAYSNFPRINKMVPHADRVIKRIKDNGGQIGIWTCRTGIYAEQAKEFLSSHNIPYDLFNEEFPEIAELFEGSSRKIFADVYIDDKSIDTIVNGGVDWLKIEQQIFGNTQVSPTIEDIDVSLITTDGCVLLTSQPLTTDKLKSLGFEVRNAKIEPLTKG